MGGGRESGILGLASLLGGILIFPPPLIKAGEGGGREWNSGFASLLGHSYFPPSINLDRKGGGREWNSGLSSLLGHSCFTPSINLGHKGGGILD